MKLSIIVPAYNEEKTIQEIINRIKNVVLPLDKEIIVVDDGSTDKTKYFLKELADEKKIILLTHQKKQGKGAAIKTALTQAKGDFILVQDADLEYDPVNYPDLLEPLLKNKAVIVYGSRNLKKNPRSFLSYYWGGKFLTSFLNLLFKTKLTDINTGYKVFRREILNNFKLKENGFAFCEEITCQAIKKGFKVKEIPIDYYPRTIKEGKKINWKDGLHSLRVILKNRF